MHRKEGRYQVQNKQISFFAPNLKVYFKKHCCFTPERVSGEAITGEIGTVYRDFSSQLLAKTKTSLTLSAYSPK